MSVISTKRGRESNPGPERDTRHVEKSEGRIIMPYAKVEISLGTPDDVKTDEGYERLEVPFEDFMIGLGTFMEQFQNDFTYDVNY